jgi:hypothetical protein
MTTEKRRLTLKLDLHGDDGMQTVLLDFDTRQAFDRFWSTIQTCRREAHFDAEKLWPSFNPYGGRTE